MSLNRRQFLLGSARLGTVFSQKREATPEKPNILLILADDVAAWMLGCYGNQEIRTPNLDVLARSGTKFLHNFVCTPAGSPSRATLFTGRTPMQHGIQDFLTSNPTENPPQGQKAAPDSFSREVMIADLLGRAGYECGYVGKWALGGGQQPQHEHRFWYTMADEAAGYENPTVSRDGKLVEEKGYLADLLSAAAVEFLGRQSKGKPFFLTVSYLNSHPPYEGHPQKYYDLYANTGFDTAEWQPAAANALRGKDFLADTVGNLRKCAASVTALDDQIPILLRALGARGLRENTLVVFTSDKGSLLGRHGLWDSGLASDPINMYEEVVRVPLIWNWIGRVPVEGARPELTSSYDMLPTLCEVAGVPVPADRKLCGRSYHLLAFGRPLPKKEIWPTTVFGHYRNTEMARDSRYKVVIRNGGQGPNESYDLGKDPREKINQFDNLQYLNQRERLMKELADWKQQHS